MIYLDRIIENLPETEIVSEEDTHVELKFLSGAQVSLKYRLERGNFFMEGRREDLSGPWYDAKWTPEEISKSIVEFLLYTP